VEYMRILSWPCLGPTVVTLDARQFGTRLAPRLLLCVELKDGIISIAWGPGTEVLVSDAWSHVA
jgi:hypothetical protein